MKIIVVLILFITVCKSFAKEDVHIDDVFVSCEVDASCNRYDKSFQYLKNKTFSIGKIKKIFKNSLLDSSIKEFSYFIHNRAGKNYLYINVSQKQKISSIIFKSNFNISKDGLLKTIPLKENDYYNDLTARKSVKFIKAFLLDRGVGDSEVSISSVDDGDRVVVSYSIHSRNIIKVNKVSIESDLRKIPRHIIQKLKSFEGETWNKIKYKVTVDSIEKQLLKSGYFSASIQHSTQKLSDNNVALNIRLDIGERVSFDFRGNSIFSRQEILDKVFEMTRQNLGRFGISEIKSVINKLYREMGIFDSKIDIREITSKGINLDKIKSFYVNIGEGYKIPIDKLVFIGVNEVMRKRLHNLYRSKSSVLASRGFLDLKFLSQFKSDLMSFYLRNGFVKVNVQEPEVKINYLDRSANVRIIVSEFRPSIIKEIKINNVGDHYTEVLLDKLKNKVGRPINILEIQNDIDFSLKYIKGQGFYFADLISQRADRIVRYSTDLSESYITIDFDLERKTYFNKVVVIGNRITKNKVISREVKLLKGDIITPNVVDKIKTRLYGLGIFSKVQVVPTILNGDDNDNKYFADLRIYVEEADFGHFEIAPGYRTDIGVKFSSSVAYRNLMGMNREVQLWGQLNQRLDFDTLDERRRYDKRRVVEYLVNLDYREPYLFNQRVQFETFLSQSRKRFFGFDAQIFKVSALFSKSFWSFLTTSLRYQFEEITQFDATESKDNDKFRIGGITPAVSFDFRDNTIAPRSGSFFSISCEFANPYFASMSNNDIEINFYKIISRNKFYIPIGNNFVLASSISIGHEKNLADEGQEFTDNDRKTKGYIPSIKVFRLTGVDSVRGYEDYELNKISSGQDISEVVIDNEAYFANLKIEPRYYISDSIVTGLFFDAGKIYVNEFRPLTLETSFGITFKVLTPVGSLDFDYGVKLNRRYGISRREKIGKFHLSIGFF